MSSLDPTPEFDQLPEAGRRLLNRLAWTADEPVPVLSLEVLPPNIKPRDGLMELVAASFATRSGSTFTVAPGIQGQVLATMSAKDRKASLPQALAWMDKALDGIPWDEATWPAQNAIAPHALSVASHAEAAGIHHPTVDIFNHLGLLYKAQHLPLDAEKMLRRAGDDAAGDRDRREGVWKRGSQGHVLDGCLGPTSSLGET